MPQIMSRLPRRPLSARRRRGGGISRGSKGKMGSIAGQFRIDAIDFNKFDYEGGAQMKQKFKEACVEHWDCDCVNEEISWNKLEDLHRKDQQATKKAKSTSKKAANYICSAGYEMCCLSGKMREILMGKTKEEKLNVTRIKSELTDFKIKARVLKVGKAFDDKNMAQWIEGVRNRRKQLSPEVNHKRVHDFIDKLEGLGIDRDMLSFESQQILEEALVSNKLISQKNIAVLKRDLRELVAVSNYYTELVGRKKEALKEIRVESFADKGGNLREDGVRLMRQELKRLGYPQSILQEKTLDTFVFHRYGKDIVLKVKTGKDVEKLQKYLTECYEFSKLGVELAAEH